MIAAVVLFVLMIGAAEARDPAQVRAFRATHPCPATSKLTGACPGWVVDHIRPLCFGGADAPSNMTWQAKDVSFVKDAFEREACALRTRCSKP